MGTLPTLDAIQRFERASDALSDLLVSVPLTREDCVAILALRERFTILRNELRK